MMEQVPGPISDRIDKTDREAIFPGRPADAEPPAEGTRLPAGVQGVSLPGRGVKATLVYHLRSGRIVREPADEWEDMPLENLAQAMLRSAGGGRQELVPLLTITDDYGRDHIIPTGAVEDVEIVLQETVTDDFGRTHVID